MGEPAAGKTTIASLLSMAALDQWNASILRLDTPAQVADHWNPDEPSQFFWLDDAFGVTQYESSLVHSWNHIIPQVRTMLRKRVKIVMTSRDYIYNRARNDIKEGAFPLLEESQVVIDVHELALDERRQILYNHMKLGAQPQSFRTEIKPFLETVATHENFVPETARRLADPLFTKNLSIDPYSIGAFVERRDLFLQEVLRGLDSQSKAALALIYMRGGRLLSPISLRDSEAEAVDRLGSDIGGCVTALEALKGSLVLHSCASGESVWQFKHPTVGDAYAAILVQSPELLGIFVQGSTPEKLLEQVTCGDIGMENAIVIPRSLYDLVLSKLSEISQSQEYKSTFLSAWRARSSLLQFLSRRCSKDFILQYIKHDPEIMDRVSEPGLYLHAVSEVDLAVRLHEFGLFPESNRRRFIDRVSRYALQCEDADGLVHKGIRKLFSDEEFEALLSRVHLELLPRLEEVRAEWEESYDLRESPEEHMQMLLASFESLKKCFAEDDDAVSAISEEIKKIERWIEENAPEESEGTSWKLGNVEEQKGTAGDRSIFEDVDA